jgi:hypothetical protein
MGYLIDADAARVRTGGGEGEGEGLGCEEVGKQVRLDALC